MGNKIQDKDDKGRSQNDPRADQEVRSGGVSRREALGWLGGLAVLMGVPSVEEVAEIKPSDPRWSDVDDSSLVSLHDHDLISFETLNEIIARRREEQTCEDLSDCIHVMNPDRMTDLGGHTIMKAAGDKTAPMSYTRKS